MISSLAAFYTCFITAPRIKLGYGLATKTMPGQLEGSKHDLLHAGCYIRSTLEHSFKVNMLLPSSWIDPTMPTLVEMSISTANYANYSAAVFWVTWRLINCHYNDRTWIKLRFQEHLAHFLGWESVISVRNFMPRNTPSPAPILG